MAKAGVAGTARAAATIAPVISFLNYLTSCGVESVIPYPVIRIQRRLGLDRGDAGGLRHRCRTQKTGDKRGWGAEPREKRGRLITEQGGESIASERGDWPCFYSQLERALRQGSTPPVDPQDAVAGLEILDATRPQRGDRQGGLAQVSPIGTTAAA